MARENHEEVIPAFADGLLRRGSSQKSYVVKCHSKVGSTNFPRNDISKVPISVACPHREIRPITDYVTNDGDDDDKNYIDKERFPQNYINERKIAYVEMSRTSDGSSILLGDCSCDRGTITLRDHMNETLPSKHSENLLILDDLGDPCRSNLNYADIDFFPSRSRPQTDLATSSRTKYACIDLSKTLAVHKTGRELLEERNINASVKIKGSSNSSASLKKASSCFYVSTPTEYFDSIEPLMDKTELTACQSKAFIQMGDQMPLSPKPQRKFSLDFIDQAKYPSTLPHSKKKF